MNMLERFYLERNSSTNTRKSYRASVGHLENMTGLSIDEMINIAKSENTLLWEETQLYRWLIEYRNWLYGEFKETTASKHLSRCTTVFRHYRIRIDSLPYFSTKQTRKSEIIDYEDLPNREILKRCIEVRNPLLKALTLFMSSTGISRVDTHELTIKDYLEATSEYHETDNIYDAIELMNTTELSIVPVFKLHRRKTGETYRTFASPESVRAINYYLLTRNNLQNHDPLFKISFRHFNRIFTETNKLLGLGEINDTGRFTPQMLRRYHATQLAEAGMNDSFIDLLQGRKPRSIARRSYIRVKRETLKNEYIRCLPYLVIEDIEEVKSELDVTKEQLEVATNENIELKTNIDNIWDELNNMKKRQDIWENLKKG